MNVKKTAVSVRTGWVWVALVGLALLVVRGHEASGANTTGEASATLVEPLTVTSVQELRFGQVRPGDTSGTVVVTTQNDRFATGGTGLAAGSPPYSRAEFTVSGPANQAYNIELQGNTALHDQGGQNLILDVTDLIGFSVNVGAEGTVGQFDGTGQDMVYVGGTLQVPPDAKNGKYEGDVTLIVSF